MGYLYVALTVLFTVYGQVILKWQVNLAGELPLAFSDKLLFLSKLLAKPFVLSAFAAAFVASLTWMAAMTKLQLSSAYPFMSLSFILVLVLSGIFLNEPITWQKIGGLSLIICGLIISSRC